MKMEKNVYKAPGGQCSVCRQVKNTKRYIQVIIMLARLETGLLCRVCWPNSNTSWQHAPHFLLELPPEY